MLFRSVAIYGFMGMLAFGYSQFMVPMFALGPSPDERLATLTFVLALGAIGLAVAAALAGIAVGLTVAAAVGLGAVVLHVRAMGAVLAQGMRKRLGLSFVLVRVSWGLLTASLILGGAAAMDGVPDRIVPLFGFAALFGWLLTFLMGILQRIVPLDRKSVV